jgi:RNA polymerase sigma-70 factor (ECF subfamily)
MKPAVPSHPSPSPEAAARMPGIAATDPEKPDLRQLFAAEEAPLLRFAFGVVGRREVAEDLVQEAFLRLHKHWDEVGRPRAWLYRTVRNLGLNHLRKSRRETITDEPPEWRTTAPADAEAARFEAAGAVRMLIAELPDADRRLLEGKYRDGLRYEQLGHRAGLSVGNVGYKLHHLLKDLAAGLRKMVIEGPEG